MSINFIPNDPKAGPTAPAMRVIAKHADRVAPKSGFTYSGVLPEALYNPGTAGFVFWQCREAALRAVDAWEACAGAHTKWQGNRSKLALNPDQGIDLNAFYNRASFSFFHKTIGSQTFFSGASTDVVSHEIGHGLLDSVRADLWSANFLEVGALHEAFGDCMAILTALNDQESRVKLLATGANLRHRNFVETTAEELSSAIRLLLPTHNAAEPRHAFNTLKFQLPQTLPSNGGPGVLINEVHSFGMIFTGCFWDLLASVFAQMSPKSEGNLLVAARKVGKILIAGLKAAVITPRFLQSVGRAMVLADQAQNAGANRDLIRNAFALHNIMLGSNAMLAPTMALAGAAPTKAAALGASTRRDLLQRIGAPKGAKLSLSSLSFFGEDVVRATHVREVPLGAISKSLKGVVALASESVHVGSSGKAAAVFGALPDATDTETEVTTFVESLLEHDRIDLGKPNKKKTKAVSAIGDDPAAHYTHAVATVGGKKVLQRLRFICRTHPDVCC